MMTMACAKGPSSVSDTSMRAADPGGSIARSLASAPPVSRMVGRPVKFTRDDFIPIARFIADPMVLVVNDKVPYKNLKEFVADAKAKPNQLIFSSSGLYGALHLPTALFMKSAGIQMKHLPTAGGGPALTAILGNNSQVLATSIAALELPPRRSPE